MRSNTAGPVTRFGILASGAVTVVATPAELDAREGWWSKYTPEWGERADIKRSFGEGMKDGSPRWLAPVKSPRVEALAQIRASAAASKAAGVYVGKVKHTIVPSRMNPAQLRAALAVQARRLAQKYDESDDVTLTLAEAA